MIHASLFKLGDLGKPLCDSPHAVSVCLPLWDHVVGYEEGRREVLDALACGYPRFSFHPFYRRLCAEMAECHAGADEYVLALPSEAVASRCVAFAGAGRVVDAANGIWLAIVPQALSVAARSFWQHTGLVVSSRQAENALRHAAPADGTAAKQAIRDDIAALAGVAAADVYLFPMGMAAIFTAYEAVVAARGAKIVQLGFPYVDTLKIIQKFGRGGRYIPYDSPGDLDAVRTALDQGDIAAVFCEIPGNPLLRTIDLSALSGLLRPRGVPLVVDDTLATWANVDLSPYADLVVTSLTKFYSGEPDVAGGSLVVNPGSPWHDPLKARIDQVYEDLLYPDDAVVLAAHGRDFGSRMVSINGNAEALANYLASHPAVENVWYPAMVDRAAYDAIRRQGGGYGGLLSFTMKDPNAAPGVYDRLEIAKGPSLGTAFTLACPYTLLAHFSELDFAARSGIRADLIRVSVGVEEIGDLIRRFGRALDPAVDSIPVR